MKLLIISSFLPYPLFSGGHVRLYNLMKRLAKHHTLTLVCEKREYQTREDIKEIEVLCKSVIFVERKKQWSIRNILKTAWSRYPFLLTGHTQKNLQTKIQELLQKESFDLIHIETFYVMQNLPEVSLPTVLVEHNIEYLVYKRLVSKVPLFLRPLFLIDIQKLQYWERFFWKKATKLVAVSNEEKIIMERDDVEIVPNGVDINKFKLKTQNPKPKTSERRILFIGDFRWIQNRDAVRWILKEIWPQINSKLDLTLWIVGRKIPDEIRKLINDKNVIFDENAPSETEKIFAQADMLLAPIRVGGGTSYKILEAMASGVPVITTKLGIEGIQAIDGESVLLADTANDFTQKIEALLDDSLYKKIAENARILIEQQHNWEIIVKKLEKVYESAKKNYQL